MNYSGQQIGGPSNVPQVKRSHTDTFVAELHAQLNKALSVREQLIHMNVRLLGEGPSGPEVAGQGPSVAENAPFTIRAQDVIRRLEAALSECSMLIQNLSQL